MASQFLGSTALLQCSSVLGCLKLGALALASKSANPSQVSAADKSAPEFRSWHTNENQKLRNHCAPNDSATSRTLSYAPAESTGSSKVLRRCRSRGQILYLRFYLHFSQRLRYGVGVNIARFQSEWPGQPRVRFPVPECMVFALPMLAIARQLRSGEVWKYFRGRFASGP